MQIREFHAWDRVKVARVNPDIPGMTGTVTGVLPGAHAYVKPDGQQATFRVNWCHLYPEGAEYADEAVYDKLYDFYWQACGLECPVMNDGVCLKDSGKMCSGIKFDSAAAEILWLWSLDSGQDEDCGTAEYGNGWHALFRDDRAILHVNSQGLVTAYAMAESRDLDAWWEEIETFAFYPDDMEIHHEDSAWGPGRNPEWNA